MRIVVFEPDHCGHRLQYVRVTIEALFPLVKSLTLVTSHTAIHSEEFRIHLSALAPRLEIEPCNYSQSRNPISIGLDKLRALRSAVRTINPDHVYIPYADGLTQVLGVMNWQERLSLAPAGEVEGILMRGRFAYPSEHWYDKIESAAWLATTRLAPFTSLHQLDPIPHAALKRRGGRIAEITRLIPEPVEHIPTMDPLEARRRLGIPTDGRYIACFGSLDIRKGVHLLIQAFAQANLASSDRLLLMGKLAPEIRSLITEQMRELVTRKQILFIDQYVSDEMLGIGLNAVDVVCTPYPKHIGSSGIVVRAAAVGKPVLASTYGWVGAVTPAFQLGVTCSVTDIEQFSSCIEHSLAQADKFHITEGGRRFSDFHTITNFNAHITARLRARSGQPVAPDILTWETVMDSAIQRPSLLN